MNNNYKIKNIGKTKTLIYNGTKSPKKNDIEWSIDYDNKHGVDLNVNMDNNGDKSHYHQYLTNSELEELLKIPVVDKSIHQRLIEDFDPYPNNNLDLITYPHTKPQSPYGEITQYSYPESHKMHNDLMQYNQVPIVFQRSSELTKKSRPKIIKIKIYTKKHKKHKNHKNHHSSKNRSRSSNQTKSRSSRTNLTSKTM
jgi:hypothetical protein